MSRNTDLISVKDETVVTAELQQQQSIEDGSSFSMNSNGKLKNGDVIEYFSGNGQKFVATIISRAGKSTGIYKNCFNVKRADANKSFSLDLDRQVERWRLITPEEHRTLITVDNKGDGVSNAKLSEI